MLKVGKFVVAPLQFTVYSSQFTERTAAVVWEMLQVKSLVNEKCEMLNVIAENPR